jgi:hypothetical protein
MGQISLCPRNKSKAVTFVRRVRWTHFLVILMPLVLVCDIAAFVLCFWWYHLDQALSTAVALFTPVILLVGIVMLVRLCQRLAKPPRNSHPNPGSSFIGFADCPRKTS